MKKLTDKLDRLALSDLFESSGWQVFEQRILALIENDAEKIIMGDGSGDPEKQFMLHQAIGATRAIRTIMAAKMACDGDQLQKESDLPDSDNPHKAVDTRP